MLGFTQAASSSSPSSAPPRSFVAGAAPVISVPPRHSGSTLVVPRCSGTAWLNCCGALCCLSSSSSLPRRPSPTRRRSGPPPSEWVVPACPHRYCAPVGALGARRRGLCRRRFAGDRIGAFVGRASACATWLHLSRPSRYRRPTAVAPSARVNQTHRVGSSWAVGSDLNGPQSSTSFENMVFQICLRYFKNS